MGPDRWRFVSSLFTPRLLDKCPRRLSRADAVQVSRKPSLLFPPQMDDRCASRHPFFFFLTAVLATANSLELDTKLKVYLFDKLLYQINVLIFMFYQKHRPRKSLKRQLELFSYQAQGFYLYGVVSHIVEQQTDRQTDRRLWAVTAKDRQ